MPHPVLELLERVGNGDAEAAYLLCQELQPPTLTDLVRHVPAITSEIFDAISDGYSAWSDAGRPTT